MWRGFSDELLGFEHKVCVGFEFLADPLAAHRVEVDAESLSPRELLRELSVDQNRVPGRRDGAQNETSPRGT